MKFSARLALIFALGLLIEIGEAYAVPKMANCTGQSVLDASDISGPSAKFKSSARVTFFVNSTTKAMMNISFDGVDAKGRPFSELLGPMNANFKPVSEFAHRLVYGANLLPLPLAFPFFSQFREQAQIEPLNRVVESETVFSVADWAAVERGDKNFKAILDVEYLNGFNPASFNKRYELDCSPGTAEEARNFEQYIALIEAEKEASMNCEQILAKISHTKPKT